MYWAISAQCWDCCDWQNHTSADGSLISLKPYYSYFCYTISSIRQACARAHCLSRRLRSRCAARTRALPPPAARSVACRSPAGALVVGVECARRTHSAQCVAFSPALFVLFSHRLPSCHSRRLASRIPAPPLMNQTQELQGEKVVLALVPGGAGEGFLRGESPKRLGYWLYPQDWLCGHCRRSLCSRSPSALSVSVPGGACAFWTNIWC